MTDSAHIPVRTAASLILVKNAAAGPEILMGQRGAFHKFMPGRLVFPGGGVDAADSAAPLAGMPRDNVMRQLGRHVDKTMARGLLAACARELHEETGLHFGAPPDVSRMDLLCRAVTPPGNPIRFDAFFFVAPAEAASGELAGSGELEELRWLPLDQALTIDLAFPTKMVLRRLTTWLTLDDAAKQAQVALPVLRTYEWTME